MSKREEYINKTKEKLDELNVELEKLEGQVDQKVGEARVKQKELLDKLRAQSAQVQAKLKVLRKEGEGSWEKMKDEVEHVRKAFVHSFNYFKSQL